MDYQSWKDSGDFWSIYVHSQMGKPWPRNIGWHGITNDTCHLLSIYVWYHGNHFNKDKLDSHELFQSLVLLLFLYFLYFFPPMRKQAVSQARAMQLKSDGSGAKPNSN